jgi:hypothetical protein
VQRVCSELLQELLLAAVQIDIQAAQEWGTEPGNRGNGGSSLERNSKLCKLADRALLGMRSHERASI